jgi:tetratricopeptide (TPR) repeat protein
MVHTMLCAAIVIALPAVALGELRPSELEFPEFTAGPYAVGYRVEHTQDPARSFGPRSDLDGNSRAGPLTRPIRIDLWYPAQASEQRALRYREYVLDAALTPALVMDTAGARQALDAYRAPVIRRGGDPAALESWLAREMWAHRDAPAASGPFPLILYSPSINSDPYENVVLFEYLASQGYVIAGAPSLGRDEPEVSRDFPGAMTQLDDLAFVLAGVWNESFVDQRHIGILGFSWGGLIGMLLALRHAGIDAIATLDGAQTMGDYLPVASAFPWWSPRNLRAAFLEVTLKDEERELGFPAEAVYAERYRWRIANISHRDLAADAVARYRVVTGDSTAAFATLACQTLGERLTLFFDAHLKGSRDALRNLRAETPPLRDSEWTRWTALPPPPTPAQFDEIIATSGVDEAVRVFRKAREADRGAVLFDENRLIRYAHAWGPERADDLVKLLELNLEAYPNSAITWFWLGQVHLSREDQGQAIQALERAVALDPGLDRARRLLDLVRSANGNQEGAGTSDR